MNNQSSEKKSVDLKNTYNDSNFKENENEVQIFMTNNQTKKEQEKSVLTVSKFLDEEMEFLKEECISIQDSDSKWSWLTNELAEKYFISVLLPYYIVKPKLHLEDLYQLGFQAFFSRLKYQKIYFSVIKNKYLNLNSQDLIKFLIEEFGVDKAREKLENAKNRLNNNTDTIPQSTIVQNRLKIKLILDLGFSPIKCKECDIGINFLVALQLHHPTESKEIEIRNIYAKPKKDFELILEKFKKDKVELLCSNHHREKQLFYPIEFKNIIFKEDLFLMSAEEIDVYIDDYLSKFAKTERYREVINERYVSKNIEVPDKIISEWKYQTKKWIKKRFVFKELFDGKCVVCGDSNLLHLDLHHSELKNLIENWQSIAKLDCNDIMRLIIKEKCVCLCSNCHILVSYKYHISIREVLKGYIPQQELNNLSEEITLKYNIAVEKISNFKFKYKLEEINFKDPLKLEFSQDDIWKIHLMTVYYYLEIKERSFFFRDEILYDLELSPRFIYVSVKKLIDMDYIQKSSLKYSLTQKGIDKISNLIQRYGKKAIEINKKIKEYLSNKERYEFLDYVWSKSDRYFVKRKHSTREEHMFKYCTIIFDLITNKDINEFNTKELIPFFSNKNYSSTENIISRIGYILRSMLVPFNLIEEVGNPTSYQRINPLNPYEEKDKSKISIRPVEKIYKLTAKGFDIVMNGLDSLS